MQLLLQLQLLEREMCALLGDCGLLIYHHDQARDGGPECIVVVNVCRYNDEGYSCHGLWRAYRRLHGTYDHRIIHMMIMIMQERDLRMLTIPGVLYMLTCCSNSKSSQQ